MSWKSLIPLAGKRSVRDKLSEIEDEAASLPIIFGVLFGKVVENAVLSKYNTAIRFGLVALFVGMLYVYRREAKKKAKEVKDGVTGE